MTDSATPTPGTPAPPPTQPGQPGPGGGMPKWLIVVLVALIVIVLGCCGGLATCHWACNRATDTVQSKLEAATREGMTFGGGPGRSSVTLGGTKLPSNFPNDVPVMEGLTPAGLASSDAAQGSGMVMLSGTATRREVAAYYQKQMKDRGWTLVHNVEKAEGNTMIFTKDTRQVMVQARTEDGEVSLLIAYGPEP